MKQLLVIAYYFPPMGLSGVQRTLKFVKYLPEFGWQPTVLTVQPHAYFAFDDTLLQELEGKEIPIWRVAPAGIFSLFKGRKTVPLKNEGGRKMLNRISQAVFIPDNKTGWGKQAFRELKRRDLGQFNALFATAPPFTSHLLGGKLRHRYGIPLVLDYRDAWLEFPYHYYWTGWHRKKHQALEQKSLAAADAVVVTSSHIRRLLLQRYPELQLGNRLSVLTQGYDPEDFQQMSALPESAPQPLDPAKTHFVYTGIFYEDRDPKQLFRVLAQIKAQHPSIYPTLAFHMVGYVQQEYRAMAQAMGVDGCFHYHGYVEHRESIAWIQRADVVWFNIGARSQGFQTVSPGKAFEYLGSRKPILAVLPENDIRTILEGFHHAVIVNPDDDDALRQAILRLAKQKQASQLPIADAAAVARFDRRRLTGELANILDRISTTTS
ncbi:MAG: glycosyltransferase family 4 protein [Chlorobi bacterium]|nr:MAG: glycosyl transferase group 1 [Chlorobi bacterium OLB7]MBK8911887.1 glycosyltransferase family 4 protein [Chlorobiota bacterium]MBX7215472.1 glycosyltransferase family 4 protein [Candidatus Kapabacteria bacterium]